MPELPETETIARDLDRMVRGLRITAVDVHRRDVIRGTSAAIFVRRQVGVTIERVWRRAKTVVLDLGGDSRLLVTPRFTGALLVRAEAPWPSDHLAVTWTLEGGGALLYRDVRRLGTLTLADAAAFARFDASLGVEPLSTGFTTERLSRILRGSRQAVKKVLMDPSKIAGIGNIYANEALWQAGLDPSRESQRLDPGDVDRLGEAIREILPRAIAARGTSFRDYRDPSDARGSFGEQLRVYGRGGEPCAQCGARLVETHAIDGRSTVFCHRCQR